MSIAVGAFCLGQDTIHSKVGFEPTSNQFVSCCWCLSEQGAISSTAGFEPARSISWVAVGTFLGSDTRHRLKRDSNPCNRSELRCFNRLAIQGLLLVHFWGVIQGTCMGLEPKPVLPVIQDRCVCLCDCMVPRRRKKIVEKKLRTPISEVRSRLFFLFRPPQLPVQPVEELFPEFHGG